MTESLRTPFGWFNTDDARFDMFSTILNVYEQNNVSGGSLHIYLEDGNKSVSDIQFCKKYAEERSDYIGIYLCHELLYFGERFIETLINDDIHIAWAEWKWRNYGSNTVNTIP